MMTSETVAALRSALEAANTVLLTGPVDPDGDSFGACMALARATASFSDATVHVAGKANYRYDWLPGAENLRTDSTLLDDYDLVVVMDGDRTRLTDGVAQRFASAGTTALVDHHQSSSSEGYDVVLLDAASPSTCEMVHRVLSSWEIPLDADMATHLYTGIIFDTGGFKHENTQAATHRIAAQLLELGVRPAGVHAKVLHERTAAGLRLLGEVLTNAQFCADGGVIVGVIPLALANKLGITSGDTEGVVDAMLNTAGVEVACLVREAGSEVVKLSLRSRSRVNVAEIARSLTPMGGGHVRAAGAKVLDSLDGLMGRLPDVLAAAYRAES
jgi:phosphoesterase RecJ-like protein